jgi:hypothetical protein
VFKDLGQNCQGLQHFNDLHNHVQIDSMGGSTHKLVNSKDTKKMMLFFIQINRFFHLHVNIFKLVKKKKSFSNFMTMQNFAPKKTLI